MPPTLLIVDDHAAFRSTARALLECDGWNVVGEAPDGTSGMTAARDLKPDVVLLDVRLPDIDGFSVAEQLTSGGDGPAVIVTSSSDDPLYPDRARSTGAAGFVAKHDLSGEALQRLLDGTCPASASSGIERGEDRSAHSPSHAWWMCVSRGERTGARPPG